MRAEGQIDETPERKLSRKWESGGKGQRCSLNILNIVQTNSMKIIVPTVNVDMM